MELHGVKDYGEFRIEWTFDDTLLKPCPFCGAPARLERLEGGNHPYPEFSVVCGADYGDCPVSLWTEPAASKEEAIKKWNMRGRNNGHWEFSSWEGRYWWKADEEEGEEDNGISES